MIQNGVLTYAGTTITTGKERGLEMPKSTQIPEVGDWVICTKKPNRLMPEIYGARMQVKKFANFGLILCELDGEFGCIPLRKEEFYIVG